MSYKQSSKNIIKEETTKKGKQKQNYFLNIYIMLHIIKNYKNLFLGLMESKLSEWQLNAMDASKDWKIDAREWSVSGHRKDMLELKKKVEARGETFNPAGESIDRILNIMNEWDNVVTESRSSRKTVSKSINSKNPKLLNAQRQLTNARKSWATWSINHWQAEVNKYSWKAQNVNAANATLAAKHDTISKWVLPGQEVFRNSEMWSVNRRSFDNTISKLNYNQLNNLVNQLVRASWAKNVAGLSKISTHWYWNIGNANNIIDAFQRTGYKSNTEFSSKEAMQLMRNTAAILKTQNEVRKSPTMEKLKLLFDFNKDNFLTNHPNFYFGEAQALTNAVNSGGFRNPLTWKTNKMTNQSFGYLVNNIGLGSWGALLTQMNDNFYGARESFIDALSVSAASLQALSIDPRVLFLKNGMQRGIDKLGKPNTKIDTNNVRIQEANQMVDRAVRAKWVNLSHMDRSRCVSMILSKWGPSFAMWRVDVALINGKPSVGYTAYNDGRTTARVWTFVPITVASSVKLSKRTGINFSLFGGGASGIGGSVWIDRKVVAESAVDVQKRVNDICIALINNKIPATLSTWEAAAIKNLMKITKWSRGKLQTIVSGAIRGIEANGYKKIEWKRLIGVSAWITAVATYLIPTIGLSYEKVAVKFSKINPNDYKIWLKDIQAKSSKRVVTRNAQSAKYRTETVTSRPQGHTRNELVRSYNRCKEDINGIEKRFTHASMRKSVAQTVARNAIFNYKKWLWNETVISAWNKVSKVVWIKASSQYDMIVLMDGYLNATMKLNNTLDSSDPKKVENANKAFQNDFGINSAMVNKWRKAYGDFDSKKWTTSFKTDSRITFAASTPTVRAWDKNAKAGRMPTWMVPYTGVVEIVDRGEIDVTRELTVAQKKNVFKNFPKASLESFQRYYWRRVPHATIINDLAHNKLWGSAKVAYNISFWKMWKCGNDALNVKNFSITTTKSITVKTQNAISEQSHTEYSEEVLPTGWTAAPSFSVDWLSIGLVWDAYDTSSDTKEGTVSSTPTETENDIPEGMVETTPTETSNGNSWTVTDTTPAVDTSGSSTSTAWPSGPPPIWAPTGDTSGSNTGTATPVVTTPPVIDSPTPTTGTPAPVITPVTKNTPKVSRAQAERAAQVNALNDLATFCKANPNHPICNLWK